MRCLVQATRHQKPPTPARQRRPARPAAAAACRLLTAWLLGLVWGLPGSERGQPGRCCAGGRGQDHTRPPRRPPAPGSAAPCRLQAGSQAGSGSGRQQQPRNQRPRSPRRHQLPPTCTGRTALIRPAACNSPARSPDANSASCRCVSSAPSRSAASRMGAAAVAPRCAMARISTAAPSATRAAGCANRPNSGRPRAAAACSIASCRDASEVRAPGSAGWAQQRAASSSHGGGGGGGSVALTAASPAGCVQHVCLSARRTAAVMCCSIHHSGCTHPHLSPAATAATTSSSAMLVSGDTGRPAASGCSSTPRRSCVRLGGNASSLAVRARPLSSRLLVR